MRLEARSLLERAAALLALLALSLTACGDDDGGDVLRADAPVLDDEDQARLQVHLSELSSAQVTQSQSVVGGGYGYSPADRYVTGYPSDWQTPLERCQTLADWIGELDGPPSTVPVQIVESRDDGTGMYDWVARGEGGGTCEEPA